MNGGRILGPEPAFEQGNIAWAHLLDIIEPSVIMTGCIPAIEPLGPLSQIGGNQSGCDIVGVTFLAGIIGNMLQPDFHKFGLHDFGKLAGKLQNVILQYITGVTSNIFGSIKSMFERIGKRFETCRETDISYAVQLPFRKVEKRISLPDSNGYICSRIAANVSAWSLIRAPTYSFAATLIRRAPAQVEPIPMAGRDLRVLPIALA